MMRFLKKKGIKNVEDDGLLVPIDGVIKPLEEVEDPVFRNKMMGDGIAIEPIGAQLYSPIQGVVTVVFPTKHVIAIKRADGLNVILHVGIDTVELQGKGFHPKVKQGDVVLPGELLMKIDVREIAKQYLPTVMVVLENSKDFELTFLASGNTTHRDILMKAVRRNEGCEVVK